MCKWTYANGHIGTLVSVVTLAEQPTTSHERIRPINEQSLPGNPAVSPTKERNGREEGGTPGGIVTQLPAVGSSRLLGSFFLAAVITVMLA